MGFYWFETKGVVLGVCPCCGAWFSSDELHWGAPCAHLLSWNEPHGDPWARAGFDHYTDPPSGQSARDAAEELAREKPEYTLPSQEILDTMATMHREVTIVAADPESENRLFLPYWESLPPRLVRPDELPEDAAKAFITEGSWTPVLWVQLTGGGDGYGDVSFWVAWPNEMLQRESPSATFAHLRPYIDGCLLDEAFYQPPSRPDSWKLDPIEAAGFWDQLLGQPEGAWCDASREDGVESGPPPDRAEFTALLELRGDGTSVHQVRLLATFPGQVLDVLSYCLSAQRVVQSGGGIQEWGVALLSLRRLLEKHEERTRDPDEVLRKALNDAIAPYSATILRWGPGPKGRGEA